MKKSLFFIRRSSPGLAILQPLLYILLSVVFLVGCNAQPVTRLITPGELPTINNTKENNQSSLDQIQDKNVLVVGTAVTKPFEYYDPETAKLIGFDIDLINNIAEQMGVEVEFVEMSFANLIPALQYNKVDMTIAAMYITPEREELVDFSQPYLNTGLIMVVHPGLQNQITTIHDIKGLKVGVKIGSTGAGLAQDLNAKGYSLDITEYKDTFDSFLDLEVERVDLIFNDYLNTLSYIKNSGSRLNIVNDEHGKPIFLSQVGLGIAVNQNNGELLDVINNSLLKMNQNGYIQELNETWLLPGS